MKQITLLAIAVVAMTCTANSQKPTKDDVIKVMKQTWENPASNTKAKSTIEINDIKFGNSEKSNYAHQLDGIPKGATVTHTKIDFTQLTHYTDKIQKTRRIMTAFVYKNQFGEWSVMNNGTKYVD